MIHFNQWKLRWKRSFILHQDTAYSFHTICFHFSCLNFGKANTLLNWHKGIVVTSVSLMLRSNPAPPFSYTAVCTSSHQSLFECHFFAWGNSIMDGKQMHQQLPAHYHDSFYFVCSQGERTGIDLCNIIKYGGMKQDTALCILYHALRWTQPAWKKLL